jgi:Zn-dependent peptidase ImmA (M78 family)
MNIPKSFTLGAIPYKVTIVNHIDKGESLGVTDADNGVIMVMRDLPRFRKEQTFCHELVHALLDTAGRSDLGSDETLVDVLGTLLHQYLQTNKGVAK